MKFVKILLIAFTVSYVLYSRFVGLNWGFPYPMHPDERNMVSAILQINCFKEAFPDCMNPHFFAYGQLPLYGGYLIALIIAFFKGQTELNFLLSTDITLALRVLSATASSVTVFFMYKITKLFINFSFFKKIIYILLLAMVPIFIQFSHFGTTESLLMLFCTILVLLSLNFLDSSISFRKYILYSGIIIGLSLSTKVSSAVFACIPFFSFLIYFFKKRNVEVILFLIFSLIKIGVIATAFFIIFSPFNFLDFEAFVHSLNYESSVGVGSYKAFYTRQFEYTLPLLFQGYNIFPYALSILHFLFAVLGIIFIKNNKKGALLKLAFFCIFLTNAFMYAKWTRFIAPAYPFLIIFSVVFLNILFEKLKTNYKKILKYNFKTDSQKLAYKSIFNLVYMFIVLLLILPGVSYLKIYETPDVRFLATQYIFNNIKSGEKILAETANVVDIPIENFLIPQEIYRTKFYNPVSFNFYELHHESSLNHDLKKHLEEASYIFVPSRRIFYNHTCLLPNGNTRLYLGYSSTRCKELKKEYPQLNAYYEMLFDKKGSYKLMAEISSFPRIEFFGKTLISFPDENAEETFTVFDHPVIRIYKKM